MATIVTCSDSRVHSHALDLDPDGDLFMVREIGNQVVSGEGSVEYGVRHLHTPLLMVIGHSACGAVKAAMGDCSGLEPAIRKDLDTMKLEKGNPDDADAVKGAVQRNVNAQVVFALSKFAPEIEQRKLAILGAVYDFRDDYKQGYGRLVLLNFNGETNPEEFKKSVLFTAD